MFILNSIWPCAEDLTLSLAWDGFWRENTHDGIYGPAVNLIQSGRTGNARYVGNQAEMTVGMAG